MHIQSLVSQRKKLSLTSLIDVIFLLLLFFMLSSTFSKYSELEINAARHGSGAATESRTYLVSIDDTQIRLNGQLESSDSLSAKLNQPNEENLKRVVITSSSNTSTQQLVDVLTELSMIEKLAITIAR